MSTIRTDHQEHTTTQFSAIVPHRADRCKPFLLIDHGGMLDRGVVRGMIFNMSRQKKKRKCTSVRTDMPKLSTMDKKTKEGIGAAILSITLMLAREAINIISPLPFVGVILLGFVVVLGWFALLQFEWLPFLSRKYIKYPVYAVILVIFLLWAWHVRGARPNSPKDANQASATTNIQNSPGNRVATIGEAHGPVYVDQSAGHESAQSLEEEISIELQGGDVCDDCETRFARIPSFAGPKKTVITARWPVIISNNGRATVSVTHYTAVSRIHGRKRDIETKLLDSEGSPTSLPINVKAGESTKLFLLMPIHIIGSVYDLVRDVPEFSRSFTPDALNAYLEKSHGMDLYGNRYRYAEKAGGSGPDRAPAHVFTYNEDGTLAETGMQADQLTVEFRTARGGRFSARAIYYDGQLSEPPHVLAPLPRGKAATIEFDLEPVDSLPTEE